GEGGVATLGGDEAGPGPEASVDPEEAFLEFAECLREQGVDVGDPGEGEGILIDARTQDREAFREAEEACGHLIEDVVQDAAERIPEEDRERLMEQQLAFAECMRDQGIDFPDPQFGEDGLFEVGPSEGVDPEDPAFREAMEACDHLFQGPGGLRERGP
ncbi:MAG: hypothetical protein ACRDIZ_07995, partial [Actinomycetota bacterium]